MAAEWHYSKAGKQHGPVSAADLKALVKSGELAPTDLIWKEGLAEWKTAGSIKGLTDYTDNAPPNHASNSATAKKLFQRAEQFAQQVGKIATEAVAPSSINELSKDSGQPAVFLREEFFGGRTQIGVPPESINSLGVMLGMILFSWPYVVPFLYSLGSSWEFLPFQRTEFVLIRLRQRIMWMRLLPFFVMWMLIIFAIGIVALILTIFASGIFHYISQWLGGSTGLFAALVFVSGFFIGNFVVWRQLANQDSSALLRCQIVLEYGFPKKHVLLSGLSDAPVSHQIDGVLKLCAALSKTEFSSWEQFSSHSDQSGIISAILTRLKRLAN